MKNSLLLILGIAFSSCAKKEHKPLPPTAGPYKAELSMGDEISSKWICTEGDTTFSDTLVLTLKSVSLNKKTKSEVLTFEFSYPVWQNNSLVCSKEDYNEFTQLIFNNEACMTVRFVLVKKQ